LVHRPVRFWFRRIVYQTSLSDEDEENLRKVLEHSNMNEAAGDKLDGEQSNSQSTGGSWLWDLFQQSIAIYDYVEANDFIPCHPKLGQGELTKRRGFADRRGFASRTINKPN